MATKYIKSIKSYRKILELPADKSILHRAILLGGIADGVTKIYAKFGGLDNLTTLHAMQKLGRKIDILNNNITIYGDTKFKNNILIDCQNSGTTMRLLAGLLCSQNIRTTLIGDSSLMQRPMERVANLLVQMGAKIQTTNLFAPIEIYPSGQAFGQLNGGNIEVKIASAQLKSAVLLAGLHALHPTTVQQKVQTRDHTERMLKTFGADIQLQHDKIVLMPSKLSAQTLEIPGDCSSAAFFLALGAIKGRVTCKNICINPTRSYFLKIMQNMGVQLQIENKRVVGNEEVADVTTMQSKLKNIRIMSDEVPYIIDELPILAILMCYAEGESQVWGAGELKVKESNRLQGIVDAINAMGGSATVVDSGFKVYGKGMLEGGRVQSLHDHRIAMSAAIALAGSRQGGSIENAECVAISFKNFYNLLEGV